MKDKVLLISPEFFDYHKMFKQGIMDLGLDCDWYSDRPNTSFATKALLRLNPKFLNNKIREYLEQILSETKKQQYKYVMVVMGEVLTEEFMTKLKKQQPNAKYVYVFWDSIVNFSCGLKLVKYFDRVYTTDRKDAEKYKYNFIPLCYNPYVDTTSRKTEYDFSFIGTIKNGKNRKVNKLIEDLNKKYTNGFVYKYIQGKSVLLYNKCKYSEDFAGAKIKDYKYCTISEEEAVEVFKKSMYVLDVPMNKQKALTGRSLNVLFLKKKLITTNKDIVNYDFYNERDIYVYDQKKGIDFNSPFFNSEFEEIPNFEKYGLLSWLSQLLFN